MCVCVCVCVCVCACMHVCIPVIQVNKPVLRTAIPWTSSTLSSLAIKGIILVD